MEIKKYLLLGVSIFVIFYVIGYFPAILDQSNEEKIIHVVFSSFDPIKPRINVIETDLLNKEVEDTDRINFEIYSINQTELETISLNGTWFYYYKIDNISLLTTKYGSVRITKYCSRMLNNTFESGACGTYSFDIKKEKGEWMAIPKKGVVVN